MELEDGKKGLFVADVEEAGGVEVAEAGGEGLGAPERGDEGGHVLGYEEGVHPGAAFVGFVAVGVEVAGGEVVEGGAERWVLVAECAV